MFAHLGLAVFILGATIVENNKVEKEVVIKIGDTIQVKDYTFEFKNISEYEGPNYQGIMAKFLVYENNNLLTELYPEKRIYASNNMPMTEAGIDPGLSRDLYITLGTLINDDVWSVRIYHKPLIRLIWLGALMMVFGGILSVLYKRKNLAFSR
jgi:cytochrome c-type biogenesis protein CcmF